MKDEYMKESDRFRHETLFDFFLFFMKMRELLVIEWFFIYNTCVL